MERKQLETLVKIVEGRRDTILFASQISNRVRFASATEIETTDTTASVRETEIENNTHLWQKEKKGGGLCPVLIRLLVLMLITLIILTFWRKLKK